VMPVNGVTSCNSASVTRSGIGAKARKEPNFSYRFLRAIYPAFPLLLPNRAVRADDLARAMAEVVVQKTGEREGWIFENRFVGANDGSFH